MWVILRWTIAGILLIGLPIFIYLAFIAKEPVFGPEQDVELGRQSERAIANGGTQRDRASSPTDVCRRRAPIVPS